jgi:hypothetical protein
MNGLVRIKGHTSDQERQFEQRLLMQATILTVYFLSAVLTGCLFRYIPAGVGALSALSVLFVAAYGFIRHSSPAD